MGAQVSSNYSTIDEISKITNNVIMKNDSTCSSTATSTQKITLGNVKGGLNMSDIKFTSAQTVNLDCLQNSENNAKLISDIKKEITKAIENKLDGQNFGVQMSRNYSSTKSVSDVANSIKIENIKNCISNAINEQIIEVKDITEGANIKSINMDSSQDVVLKCIQSDTNTVEAISKLDTKIKEDMKNTISGFLSSYGIIIIVVIVLILALLFVFRGKKAAVMLAAANVSSTAPAPTMQQAPIQYQYPSYFQQPYQFLQQFRQPTSS